MNPLIPHGEPILQIEKLGLGKNESFDEGHLAEKSQNYGSTQHI